METKYQLKKLTSDSIECGPALGCPAIYELTPKSMECGVGACPNIYELTPKSMECGVAFGCPAIYKGCGVGFCPTIKEHEDKYLIIGKIEDAKKFGLEKKVGGGEILISVPKKLIDEMKK